MINAIGDVAMQQTIRAIYNSVNHEQALVAHKNDQLREKRTVEKIGDSTKTKFNLPYEENTKTKNTFEDGQIVVEKYNADGRLIRKIPPGYLPFGEIA